MKNVGANFSLKQQNITEMNTDITIDHIDQIINNLENETKWHISKILSDIKDNKAKSYSITKDNPRCSLFVFGGETEIIIKIDSNGKEAKLTIPR